MDLNRNVLPDKSVTDIARKYNANFHHYKVSVQRMRADKNNYQLIQITFKIRYIVAANKEYLEHSIIQMEVDICIKHRYK